MIDAFLRPLRVWSTPSRRAAYGRYWWWQCRICGDATKDLIPFPGPAHDDARRHFGIMHAEDEDA